MGWSVRSPDCDLRGVDFVPMYSLELSFRANEGKSDSGCWVVLSLGEIAAFV